MIRGIDHIELIVRDVDEHVSFFQAMGFELLQRTLHHGGSAELKAPGEGQPVLEIHTVTGEESIGINHIAFKVDDAREAYDALTAKGVGFAAETHLVEATGRTIANFRDPDGWRLQLVDSHRGPPEG